MNENQRSINQNYKQYFNNLKYFSYMLQSWTSVWNLPVHPITPHLQHACCQTSATIAHTSIFWTRLGPFTNLLWPPVTFVTVLNETCSLSRVHVVVRNSSIRNLPVKYQHQDSPKATLNIHYCNVISIYHFHLTTKPNCQYFMFHWGFWVVKCVSLSERRAVGPPWHWLSGIHRWAWTSTPPRAPACSPSAWGSFDLHRWHTELPLQRGRAVRPPPNYFRLHSWY